MNAAMPGSGFPRLGWLGVLWLAAYLPAYQSAYGTRNFLFLCNIGVILTAIGLIARSRLLLSSQAVAAPIIALVWALDVGWKLTTGEFLFGGTSYMWDPAYPLFARLLSLYHVAWPLLLWYVLRRTGYDPRGWPVRIRTERAQRRSLSTPGSRQFHKNRDREYQRQEQARMDAIEAERRKRIAKTQYKTLEEVS